MLLGLVVLNGLGEEGGWRGFAQEQLQARHGPVRAALLTAVGWRSGTRRCSSSWPPSVASAPPCCPASSPAWSPAR
ncbi:CPBP family intramembrane glutamic endopeptidase [Micromonospora carbonacea]|uniref:CPBP family intramembrane glutamic endopeptidase n=1 Tax=Micromonospora carbonacea TaxID=47853 RepID=UPI003D96108B